MFRICLSAVCGCHAADADRATIRCISLGPTATSSLCDRCADLNPQRRRSISSMPTTKPDLLTAVNPYSTFQVAYCNHHRMALQLTGLVDLHHQSALQPPPAGRSPQDTSNHFVGFAAAAEDGAILLPLLSADRRRHCRTPAQSPV